MGRRWQMSFDPKIGRPRASEMPAGLLYLLEPEWHKALKQLPKVFGGPEFLKLSRNARNAFYLKFASIAASRFLDDDTIKKWFTDCMREHPDVTLFSLLELRKGVRRLN